jgi:hypothetical protein
MPVSWAIQDGIVVLRFVGHCSTQEVKQASSDALRSPEFRTGMPLLVDARSSLTYPSLDEIHQRFQWLASLREKGLSHRCAVVAAKARESMHRRRITSAMIFGIDMHVCTSTDEAFAWLQSKPVRREAKIKSSTAKIVAT